MKFTKAKHIIIAAVCARPFVQAASRAGYQVTALDAFVDADTRMAAHTSFCLPYANGAFDAHDFEQVLKNMDLADKAGMVYGSGFEATPELLDKAAEYLPVLGNSSKVVRNLKQPRQFFTLLNALKIPHPEVSFLPLKNAAGWLCKHGGGSGGTHVYQALPLGMAPPRGCYFQREVAGIPVSLVFAADGRQAKVIGFNHQWLAPSPAMPYRYGGAVSGALLPEAINQQLIAAAQLLTTAVGLRGFNGIDAMMDGDKLWVLEVNPRLTATFDFYDVGGTLFELHIHACGGDMSRWPPVFPHARAHQIIYAPHDLVAPGETSWPEWVADIPVSASYIVAGQPVCTVRAEGENAKAAQALVLARASLIDAMIENYRIDF